MANGKINFIIEMDAKQYQKEVVKVEQSTEKMAKTATKSVNKWEAETKRAGNRIREHLSLAAIVGLGFAVANRLMNSFFNFIGKGIDGAIKKNADLKKSMEGYNTSANKASEAFGLFILRGIEPALKFLKEVFDNITKIFDKINAENSPVGIATRNLNNLTAALSAFQSKQSKTFLDEFNKREAQIKSGGTNIVPTPSMENYKDMLRQVELAKQALELAKKQELAQKNINTTVTDTKKETEKLVGMSEKMKQLNADIEAEELRMGKISEQKLEDQKNLNELIKSTADELTLSVIEGSALASQFKDAASNAYKLGENLININKLIQSGGDIAKGDLLAIFIDIVSVIISIAEEVLTIKDNEEDLQLIEQRISLEISKRRNDLEEIERLTNNAILQNELDILQGADKAKQIQNQKDLIKDYNDELERQNDIIAKAEGLGGESSAQSALDKAELQLSQLKQKQKDMNIIEKLIFGNVIQELINRKQAEISRLETNLNLIQESNQAETDRLQTLIDIENSKAVIAGLEGTITEEMEKQTEEMESQLDMLKKYVDLGLDLENIRTVKQITKGLTAQGYTGANLGASLQDIGVQTRAISGKTLNIFGDINNTLNQGTGNMLISQMNNLINNIGGLN